jgi:TolB-like protein
MQFLFGNYALDIDRRELTRGSELISIGPQVFDLLVYLVKNRERVVSKDDLMETVWKGRIVSESTLTGYINAVRKAVGDSGEHQTLVRTIARKGFRFVGEVREVGRLGDAAPTRGFIDDAGAASLPTALELPEKPSIAVLPFLNLSGDPEQEYFADGIVEDIITALSRVKSFFIIARNSSFTYKGQAVDVKQVSRELGVRYVLEGSVQKVGNKVRITPQLIDGTNGAHVWADSFDGTLENIFDLQDRITASIVTAIEPSLQLAEIERLKQKPPANFDAYDLHLRATQHFYEFTKESLAAAIVCLKKALIIDPNYAPAMALAASCFAWRRALGWAQDVTGEATEGLRLASRAVELGKDRSGVLWGAAFTVLVLAMDAQQAKELVYRSLLLNPNSAGPLGLAGSLETFTANPTKGLELLRRAERLNPRDPTWWMRTSHIALAHFVEGRFDQAASWARKTLAQNPRHAPVLGVLAASLAKVGQKDQAAEVVRDLLKLEPQLTLSKLRARTMYMDEGVWNKLADGLRLAGLPE